MAEHAHRGRNVVPAVFGLSVLLLAACSSAAPGSSSPSPAASEAAVATSMPELTPTPVPGLPAELVGNWETDLTQYLDHNPLCPNCGADARLIIRAHGQYAVAGYGHFRPGGNFTVDGDQITFDRSDRAGETECGNATYSWELDGDELTFTALEPDPCGRRGEALDGVTYTRAD